MDPNQANPSQSPVLNQATTPSPQASTTLNTAVQTPINSQSQNPTPVRKPRFLNAIATLSLISGIFGLLGVLPFLLLGGLAKLDSLFFIGIINLVVGISNVALFFGLRNMKKWALYLLSLSTFLAFMLVIYGLITGFGNQISANIIALVIEIALVIYFWKFRKEFT